MHSSRIRTGRSLTVCLCLPGPGRGGVVSLVEGGSGPGGVSAWSGGMSAWLGGVCLVRGGSPCPETPHPPVNRITHTCKNITLATTSLRPVITL